MSEQTVSGLAQQLPLNVLTDFGDLRRRLMTEQDALSLFQLLGGDKSFEFLLVSWENVPQHPTTEADFEQIVRELLRKHREEEFIPYIIERLDCTVIGLDLYTVHPGCKANEVEIMFIVGERYRSSAQSRGCGYFQAATFSSMKILANHGFTSTRWIDRERNPQSWKANCAIGKVDRTVKYDGHRYEVLVVTPEEWPDAGTILWDKYEQRITQAA
ncbi:hypothetical protein [Seinonella peptonophila]|uniref:hypothetical protein n=1 Tax=Seinonella peptonophila TaxID=112248 RepID=UPI001114C0ED|nr:hypothetical protein [Seinonella peptonophila]